MIVLRCTAKLLRRLRQPAKLPEPPPSTNPLGEWYADVDFLDREPFVTLLNAATGAGLVLPGRAESLRQLNHYAGEQLFKLFMHYGFDLNEHPLAGDEIRAWEAPPVFANTRDRSLLGSLNRFKDEAWIHFAHRNRSLPEAAAGQWEGLFRHPSFARPGRRYGYQDWQKPLDLVRARLLSADLSSITTQTRH
ncbi:DUF6933 domain-containing protein [Sinimarinibacterium flocculans]|uniref:DUF6933 domain-containing protein n=1 Tax=Sinimarinibacterium flocculans TaxID=985250 RepID=A0A318EAE8_9GAMM|nr:hypothetical protein [Sinimarinibacterium flocculans]PXV68526.1 hypothetical protein C8D93_104224 [Sinimarinibacterium flocculans]